MKRFYSKFRIFILTFALGLSSVPFFAGLYDQWTEIKVDLPQVQSDTPILVVTQNPSFYKKITQENLIQNRDLSLYNTSDGISNCFNHGFDDSEFNKCQKQLSEGRDFIFKHWKEKKRGYLVYEWSGMDSGCEIYIFVEPDDSGKYQIVMRSSGDYRYPNVYEMKGYSAKYKRAKDSDEDYPFDNGTYFLKIFDKDGEIVQRL